MMVKHDQLGFMLCTYLWSFTWLVKSLFSQGHKPTGNLHTSDLASVPRICSAKEWPISPACFNQSNVTMDVQEKYLTIGQSILYLPKRGCRYEGYSDLTQYFLKNRSLEKILLFQVWIFFHGSYNIVRCLYTPKQSKNIWTKIGYTGVQLPT